MELRFLKADKLMSTRNLTKSKLVNWDANVNRKAHIINTARSKDITDRFISYFGVLKCLYRVLVAPKVLSESDIRFVAVREIITSVFDKEQVGPSSVVKAAPKFV